MLKDPSAKYRAFAPIGIADRTWPNKTITTPPPPREVSKPKDKPKERPRPQQAAAAPWPWNLFSN